MIHYNILSKTRHWNRRVKIINLRIQKILDYKNELKFFANINIGIKAITVIING